MKRTLRLILLLLLVLVINSNLHASSYSRTAGGSWDDWGWSTDWVLPGTSFPLTKFIALGLGGGEDLAGAGLLREGEKFLLEEGEELVKASISLLEKIGLNDTLKERLLSFKPLWKRGQEFINEYIFKSKLFGVGLSKAIGSVWDFSTPDFYQLFPDSLRSMVDILQLEWSKTAGPWLYYSTWWYYGTPGNEFDDITLFNEGTDPQNLYLNGDRTLNGLNVVGNSWTLSGGILTFRPWGSSLQSFNPAAMLQALANRSHQVLPLFRYSGKQTFTFDAPLNLPLGLLIHVPDQGGTVRLLDKANLRGELLKTGYGTLLMEAPVHLYKDYVEYPFNVENPWTKKRLSRVFLDGGTLGIAPTSLVDNQFDFFVSDDSRLFALNGDIKIPWTLCIDWNANFDLIDNPNDSTPHSITFSGDKYDRGTINQFSHGDLIFEGTDHFEGIIKTYGGYGKVVLNGNTRANIEMKGGEIAGIGGTRGDLTARNGAIISPGYNGNYGTLSFGNVDLDSSTILNFKLGLPDRIGQGINDLIEVNGNLTLAGNLNISAGPEFGSGAYRLFNYSGNLIYEEGDLGLHSTPDGYDASRFYVQTAYPGQVNLIVADPTDDLSSGLESVSKASNSEAPKGDTFSRFQFWDGNHTAADGTILGGDGVWNNTNATWSSIDGLSKEVWDGYRAIFGGHAGMVDVQQNISVRKIDFIAHSYVIHSSNNSKLLADDHICFKVDNACQANILTEITGSGSISKRGFGRLVLSHNNSYTGGTLLEGGTLVANTCNALSSGLVTLEKGILRLGNTHILQVGSYTQSKDAALTLRVNSPRNHDRLVVNGNANLGGILFLEGKPSNFRKGMPLITTHGLNGSSFDNIRQSQPSLKRLSANYDINNVYVDSHFDPIFPYAISRNARALARHLDLFSNSDRNEELFNTLADLTLRQVPSALEKLVPIQVFALSSIGLSVSRSQMRSLQERLENLSRVTPVMSGSMFSTPIRHGLSSARVSPQINFLTNKDQSQDLWSFYMHGNGSFGRQRQDTEHEVIGYDYGQGGTFVGADYHLNDKVYVGGAVSYTYTDASFHGNRGSLSTDSYFGHLYAAYAQPKGFNLISSLSFGDHEFDLRRRVLTDTARSQPQGREVDFQSQVSYNIPLKPNFIVSPYAGLAYSAFWTDGFQEYNSQASLKIRDDQTNSLRSTVGVKAKYEKRFAKGIRKASVEAHAAWDHEYCDAQSRGINAEWVGSGVPSFPVRGGQIDPDTLGSGVNLRVSITNPLSVTAGYNIAANQDYISHGFSVGVNLTF